MRATPVEVEPAIMTGMSLADLSIAPTSDVETLNCWVLSRKALEVEAERLNQCLSDDERARRDRFVQSDDRVRFGLYRGALRSVLSNYVAVPPERIRFRIMRGGKPELDSSCHVNAPRFNLAHSGDVCCIAIAHVEVGVDVECPDRATDPLAVALHSFHPAEAAVLAALGDAARLALFLRWWTAKEAMLKALGVGLAGGIGRIDLSNWRDGEAAELCDETEARWILRFYALDRGAVALAAPNCVRSIILRSVPGSDAASGALIKRSS